MSILIRSTVCFTFLWLSCHCSPVVVANDESNDTSIKDANKILQLLKTSGNRKHPLLPESGNKVGEHTVTCQLNMPEKWNVNISISQNRKYAFLVFPCSNPSSQNQGMMKRLMVENRSMGLMRFEYNQSANLICLVYPVINEDLDFDKLESMTVDLIFEAKRTQSLWSPAKTKVTDASKVNQQHHAKGDTSKTESKAGKNQLTRRIHDLLKSDRTGTFSYKKGSDKRSYSGTIEFKANGTYTASSTDDKDTRKDSGVWKTTDRGIALIPDVGNCMNRFSATMIENGKASLRFEYSVPTRLPVAGSPPLPNQPVRLSSFIREIELISKSK